MASRDRHRRKPGLIGVIGAGTEDAKLNALAHEVGVRIAQSGNMLVNGGLGGVMQASAAGCKSADGISVGLLPGLNEKDANPFINVRIPTGLGEGRNLLIVRAAGALIAIGGGYGTLSEIALALKIGKPVIGLCTWGVSRDVICAKTPAQAVRIAVRKLYGAGKDPV